MNRQFSPSHSRARIQRIAAVVVIVAAISIVPVTRNAILGAVHGTGMAISRGTHAVGGWIVSLGSGFRSKIALEKENTLLKDRIAELSARTIADNDLMKENTDLKATLGRMENTHFTLASVLEKPSHSLYDTLVIDGGARAGLKVGQVVYANGETPIGTTSETYDLSALVTLYSSSGQKTDARLSPAKIDITLVGLGGGNFSATVPHDLLVADDAVVTTKELNPRAIALFKKITSDPRDPFQTLLLSAPVNMNELNFVQVKQ